MISKHKLLNIFVIFREDWKPVLTINAIIIGLQYLFLVSYLSEFLLEKQLFLLHFLTPLSPYCPKQQRHYYNYLRHDKYLLCSISQRNFNRGLGEWEKAQHFSSSQTSNHVSIKQLDYKLEISTCDRIMYRNQE